MPGGQRSLFIKPVLTLHGLASSLVNFPAADHFDEFRIEVIDDLAVPDIKL